jgi:hypothetical protein
MDVEAVKAEVFQFIKENSGHYYEVGMQVNFSKDSLGCLRIILRQLEAEGK